MADYRTYCLDGDRNIGLAEWIEAERDDDAVSKAHQLRPNAYICEIWQKQRLVAKINNEGRTDRPAG